jgi:hypothetical protein
MFTAAGCRVIAMMTLKLTSRCLNMSIRDELFGNFKERAHHMRIATFAFTLQQHAWPLSHGAATHTA